MQSYQFVATLLCLILGGHFALAQDMDTELTNLTETLSVKIKANGNKKVTVLDFTDLQGGASELGRYIAEQLTVDFVMTKRDFAVLDRANLKSILAEHKLTATGLVDPANAKQLGKFAGVDALILGNIIPIGSNITLTVKVITTETAEVVAAAKVKFKSDDTVQQFLSKAAPEGRFGDKAAGAGASNSEEEKAKVVKSFGDLRVELLSLRIVNGRDYLLSLNVTNVNPKKTIYVDLECEGPVAGALKSKVEDPEGFQFISYEDQVTGLLVGSWTFMGWGGPLKKILPNDSVATTIKFASNPYRAATPGKCHIQLGFLDVTLDGYGKITNVTRRNLACDLVAVAPSGAQ